MTLITKAQFLQEHNKLSPVNLQCTLVMLNRFRKEKLPLLKDTGWCLDKHRIPFIQWISRLPVAETKEKNKEEIYRNYPETH